jgi:hypothetical protein
MFLMSDDFNWAPYGRDWWLEQAKLCGASEKNARYACGRHAGLTAAEAARQAGIASVTDGWRRGRTIAVRKLMALAAEKAGTRDLGVMSIQERRLALSAMGRSRDPVIRLRALDILTRMDLANVS